MRYVTYAAILWKVSCSGVEMRGYWPVEDLPTRGGVSIYLIRDSSRMKFYLVFSLVSIYWISDGRRMMIYL
jgi:hypothetical protein